MSGSKTQHSSTSDEQIIDMYWQRDSDAIRETENKYGHLLWNVANNILGDAQDCEECRNDAYLGIWNAIPSAKPNVFSAFIMQIMRRIAINRYKEKSRKKRVPSQLTVSIEDLENFVSGGRPVEDAYEAEEIGKIISDYVKGLNDRQRYIFIDRYYLAEPVEKTAADLFISIQTVYREVEKIKQGLKDHLERNGVYV
jgi:RNA polymerase sigma-70 factor (ECF subfamily)